MVVEGAGPAAEPTLRWRSRARTIEGIEQELNRIWSQPDLTTTVDGAPGRHVAARTSVMNLVVVARRPETAERCAATIQALTGRHPSRTLIISPADPDGPSWLDAQIQAHCVLPREDAPEVCAETIYLTCGGEAGRHLGAVVAPLLIHDLPVTVWWPGDPSFGSAATRDLLTMADRLVVDGSGWSENGLGRVRGLAELLTDRRLTIFDIALVRQARWREAIASVFDTPHFLPYLRSLRRIAVTYATHDETGDPTATNIVKPIYHVAWLASRLGYSVVGPLSAVVPAKRGPARHGFAATVRDGRGPIAVVVRPVTSTMPGGTTLRVELLAERRGSELRADVTAEAETVRVRVWQDGVEALDRAFQAPRRTDVDLLAEAIEAGGADPVAHDAIRMAGALVGPVDRA
jgi:glucose-6-phosphate dehydrogenase assembly protein OpcA